VLDVSSCPSRLTSASHSVMFRALFGSAASSGSSSSSVAPPASAAPASLSVAAAGSGEPSFASSLAGAPPLVPIALSPGNPFALPDSHSAAASSASFAFGGAAAPSRWELLGDDLVRSNPFATAAAASASSAQPCPRTYFTCVQHAGKLYVCGGFGDSKSRFNDVRAYDFADGVWQQLQPTGDGPSPLYLHSAAVWRGEMFVFGGSVGHDSNALYALDLTRQHWRRIGPSGDSAAHWPTARYGHAAVVHGDSMIIAGGCQQSNTYLADAHQYSFLSGTWRPLHDVTDAAGQRINLAYHTLIGGVGPNKDRVLLVGGYDGVRFNEHVLQLELPFMVRRHTAAAAEWKALPATARADGPAPARMPAPSCGAAVVLSSDGRTLWSFGGYTASGHANDLWSFDIEKREWRVVDTPGARPVSRAYLQGALNAADGCFYITGGFDGKRCISDFRRICVQQPAINLVHSLPLLDASQLATLAARHFGRPAGSPVGGRGSAGGTGLDITGLEALFAHLKEQMAAAAASAAVAAVSSVSPAASVAPPSAASSSVFGAAAAAALSSASFPFATTHVPALMEMGFPRATVLACLADMHAKKKDTRNFQLVADYLLSFTLPSPTQAPARNEAPAASPVSTLSASAVPFMPGNAAQPPSSNAASLQEQVHRLADENKEMKTCKVCMERQIDCVLMPCGHLCCCTDCATDMRKRGIALCPICSKPASSSIKVFWS